MRAVPHFREKALQQQPCSSCGDLRYVGRGSLPKITCQRCRRINRRPCARPGCTAAVRPRAKFCTVRCFGLEESRRRRPARADGRRLRRTDRIREAPGITWAARRRLMHKWRSQRRACFYGCGRVANTIDHVIPLARGGTNYEGNLVPCCKSCNSSKQDLLVIEFVTRRRRATSRAA